MYRFISEYANYQIRHIKQQNISPELEAGLIDRINTAVKKYEVGYLTIDELMIIISETYYEYH